ncbi:hypothetical protein EW146_g4457 [Bondarzewia mesenterica]|uniref:Uncharacterized protein n=1 Tax=Bondarzewia mesenterica TaxID=1095465 RepID=A0A4S4LUH5_9AGAM|nr:hypothetical protein EW146_g4457 [Bondarzewia mesenterica]
MFPQTNSAATQPTVTHNRNPTRPYRNALEEYFATFDNIPENTLCFLSDDLIDDFHRGRGASEGQLTRLRQEFDERANEMMRRSGGTLPTVGAKPMRDDADVHLFVIPDSPLSIRIWAGGIDTYEQYLVDFYDRRTQ